MKFRSNETVEAIRVVGSGSTARLEPFPQWAMMAMDKRILHVDPDDKSKFIISHGMIAYSDIGDGNWIVRDSDGLLSAMVDAEFRARYSPEVQ